MDCCSDYEYGAVSSPGLVREVNEDYLGFYRSGEMVLSVVADGMGGHSSGAVASRLCVETMRDIFLGSVVDDPEAILRKGLLQAHAEVLRQGSADRPLRGMGATVVAVILRSEQCWFSHLGDSRIYLVEPDKVQRLTRDHTVCQNLLEQGLLTEQQAVNHHMTHIVSKAVGHLPQGEEGIEVAQVSLSADYSLLLCSDGLTDLVSDQEILREVSGVNAQQACENLLELALARGGHDNVSIQVIRKIERNLHVPAAA